MDLKKIVKQLINLPKERDWYEFKENWFDANGIGEYISSLSNTAALNGKEHGFLIWGVNNETHEIVGTTFDYHRDVKNEPLEHYLARKLNPDINFSFREIKLNRKRIVVLVVPAASKVPTAFDFSRYLRIGSSKVNLNKYPERESYLFAILRNGLPTVESVESEYQNLTFQKLFTYYAGRGIELNKETFKKNLGLLTKGGTYNLLAQLLSDDSHIPIRISIFKGTSKADQLYSVKEFGNTCLLVSLDKVLEYGDVLNIIQADETNRVVERKDIPLFEHNAFREAVINAFVHNLWINGNAPMITVYNNRIEILSRGSLSPKQTIEGFYMGESIPVNQKLSDIFLQLHISERSGRGIPKITEIYGKDVFEFRENSIVVSLPFDRIETNVGKNMGKNVGKKSEEPLPKLNITRQKILNEMRNNPNITQQQLTVILHIGITAVQNNISFLKKYGYVERIGSKKGGYWKVI